MLPPTSAAPSSGQARVQSRVGHGRLGLLRPRLTGTVAAPSAAVGGKWRNDTTRAASIDIDDPAWPADSAPSARIGGAYRARAIVAGAREQLASSPRASSMQQQQTQGTRQRMAAPLYTPRPPSATPSITPSSYSAASYYAAASSPLSSSALEALTTEQMRASSIHRAHSSPRTDLLPAYTWDEHLPSQQIHQQEELKYQFIVPTPPTLPPAPPAVRSLESVLRGPLSPPQQRALADAGGMWTVDLLTTLASSSTRWRGFDHLLDELARMRLENPGAFIEPVVQERVHNLLANGALLSGTSLADHDLYALLRAGGLITESVLHQLRAQDRVFTSPAILVQAVASCALQSLMHVLLLQPLILPSLFALDARTGSRCYEGKVGLKDALAWLSPPPENAADSPAGDVVALLQAFVDARRIFHSSREVSEALGAHARNKASKSAAALNAQSPVREFFARRDCMFFTSASTLEEPAASARILEHNVRELMRAATSNSTGSGGPSAEVEIVLLYLRTIEHTFLNGAHSTATNITPQRTPFFDSWAALAELLRSLRSMERPLRSFLASTGASLLVTSEQEAKGPMPPPSCSALDLARLALLSPAAQEAVRAAPRDAEDSPHASSTSVVSPRSPPRAHSPDSSSSPQPSKSALLAVLRGLASRGETFSSVDALLGRVEDLLLEAAHRRSSELEQLAAVLRDARGSILASSCPVPSASDAARLLDLCDGRLDMALARLETLLSTMPKFKGIGGLARHFNDLNTQAAAERKDLYEALRSPGCPLFRSRGGGASVYTEVTWRVVHALLKAVGPEPKQVRAFMTSLVSSKVRVHSAAELVALAEEQAEVTGLLRERREALSTSVRSAVRDGLRDRWHLFEPHMFATAEEENAYLFAEPSKRKEAQLAFASSVLGGLDDDTLDEFIARVGLAPSLAPASPGSGSSQQTIHQVLMAADHLLYLRRSYPGLGVGEFDPPSELVADLLAQSQVARSSKKSLLKMLRPSSTSSGPISSDASLLLLGSSAANSLVTGDMVQLLAAGGLNVAHVLRELQGTRFLRLWATEGTSIEAPFGSVAQLATAVHDHEERCFRPLRRAMHDRLLAVLGGMDGEAISILRPDFQPTIEGLDQLLDSAVLQRALETARQGMASHLTVTPTHTLFITEAGLVDTGAIGSPSFSTLLSVHFHELLQVLSLLEEAHEVCAESLAELAEEVTSFRADEVFSLSNFLRDNAEKIFSSPAETDMDSAEARAALETILSNFGSQAFLFLSFYTRVLARDQATERSNDEARALVAAQAMLGRNDDPSFATTMQPAPMRHPSLRRFLGHLEVLQNRRDHMLRVVIDKVTHSGVLATTTTDSQPAVPFDRHHAQDILDYLDFVAEDQQLDSLALLLMTIAQKHIDSGANHTSFTHPLKLVRAIGELVRSELNGLCTFLTEADSPAAALLSPALAVRLSEEPDACEQLWIAADGSVELFRVYASVMSATQSSAVARGGFNDLSDLLATLRQVSATEIEHELEFKALILDRRILAQPSEQSPLEQPNRLSLQRALRLARELHGLTASTVAPPSSPSVLDLVSSIVVSASSSDSIPAASMRALLVELEQRIVDTRVRRAAEEEARLATEEEHQRLEQLRDFFLGEDCTLFAAGAAEAIRAVVATPFETDAFDPRQHVLVAVLAVAGNDLSVCFRGLEALMARNCTVSSADELAPALHRAFSAFGANAAELVVWLRDVGACTGSRPILPPAAISSLLNIQAAGLLVDFDKHAQLGLTHIQTLILTVAAAVRPSSNATKPAFAGFDRMVDAMHAHRSSELAQLLAWLETHSASLFVTPGGAKEFSATEGELHRLLLGAPSWTRVLRALQTFQGEGREFTSLSALAPAVTERDEAAARHLAQCATFLEASGLLALPLHPLEETAFRARVERDGHRRVQDELITLRQLAEARASEVTVETGKPAPIATYTFASLLRTLDERRIEALTALREVVQPLYTGATPPTDADWNEMLYACGLPTVLSSVLELAPLPSATSWDRLLLSVRRVCAASWHTHETIQKAVARHKLLACSPRREQRLAHFDSSYLIALLPLPALLIALGELGQPSSPAYPNVESLVNAVATKADWKPE